MTLLYRVTLLVCLSGLMTACETLYIEQPEPYPVPTVYPAPIPQPMSVYPNQPVPHVATPGQASPSPVPAPARAPSVPAAKVQPAVVPVQPIPDDEYLNKKTAPERPAGSMSLLPDPS